MWHKPCRTFHPWCPCIKTRCLSSMAVRASQPQVTQGHHPVQLSEQVSNRSLKVIIQYSSQCKSVTGHSKSSSSMAVRASQLQVTQSHHPVWQSEQVSHRSLKVIIQYGSQSKSVTGHSRSSSSMAVRASQSQVTQGHHPVQLSEQVSHRSLKVITQTICYVPSISYAPTRCCKICW